MATCLNCGQPEPHHTDWCSRESETSRDARPYYWALAIFVASCALAGLGWMNEPWIGEGGGSPLLIFGAPFLFSAIVAAGIGLPPILAAIIGLAVQYGACLAIAVLLVPMSAMPEK